MLRIHFDRRLELGGFNVYAIDDGAGRGRIAYKLNLEVDVSATAEGMAVPPAAFVHDRQMKPLAEALKLALKEAGYLEPQDATLAELTATKAHLADIQKAYQALLDRFKNE